MAEVTEGVTITPPDGTAVAAAPGALLAGEAHAATIRAAELAEMAVRRGIGHSLEAARECGLDGSVRAALRGAGRVRSERPDSTPRASDVARADRASQSSRENTKALYGPSDTSPLCAQPSSGSPSALRSNASTPPNSCA